MKLHELNSIAVWIAGPTLEIEILALLNLYIQRNPSAFKLTGDRVNISYLQA